MRLHHLFEGPDTQRGLEMVADAILRAFVPRGARILLSQRDVWGSDKLDPDDMGNMTFEDPYPHAKKKDLSRLPEKVAAFVRDMRARNLTVGFTSPSPRWPTYRGWYVSGRRLEIKLVLTDNEFAPVLRGLADTGRVDTTLLHRVLATTRETLIHELVHAYDDWASSGKYDSSKRSQDASAERHKLSSTDPETRKRAYGLYLNDPIEINARFAQTVAKLERSGVPGRSYGSTRFVRDMTWDEYRKAFVFEMPGWRNLPPEDQKRLMTRLAAHWQDGRQTYRQNPAPSVKALADRLRAAGSPAWIRYDDRGKGLIVVDQLPTKRLDLMLATLKPIMLLADVHGLTVSISDKVPKRSSDEIKANGFVTQRLKSVTGGLRDYSLPPGTTWFRRPKVRGGPQAAP